MSFNQARMHMSVLYCNSYEDRAPVDEVCRLRVFDLQITNSMVPSHYLYQCWPRYRLLYGVTRPQWVKLISFIYMWYPLSFHNTYIFSNLLCSHSMWHRQYILMVHITQAIGLQMQLIHKPYKALKSPRLLQPIKPINQLNWLMGMLVMLQCITWNISHEIYAWFCYASSCCFIVYI